MDQSCKYLSFSSKNSFFWVFNVHSFHFYRDDRTRFQSELTYTYVKSRFLKNLLRTVVRNFIGSVEILVRNDPPLTQITPLISERSPARLKFLHIIKPIHMQKKTCGNDYGREFGVGDHIYGWNEKESKFFYISFHGTRKYVPCCTASVFTSVYFWLFMSPINPNLPE